jgi:perosamine synthetase
MSTVMAEKLAIEGGPKAKPSPYGTGKRFGKEELAQLEEALEQNTLFYFKGRKVKEFTRKFADLYGFRHCVAASSCTGAIHAAVGALGISVGDEVIVPPLTDTGTLIGLLYQNAIPVFADIDPDTYTIDPESVEQRITDRTRAIIAVHFDGGPADLDGLVRVSEKHNIPLIEDCAQAFGTRYKGRRVGGFGTIGCFSTNDFKHMSTGDGGMVVTSDDKLAKGFFEFVDKNYDRSGASVGYAPAFLAPNYRMTELQAAVGIAQLDRLEAVCDRRNKLGDMLSVLLAKVPGIVPHGVKEGGKCTYFGYLGRFKPEMFRVGPEQLIKAINAEGVPAWKKYASPVHLYSIFTEKKAYPHSRFPFEGTGRNYEYGPGLCPVAEALIPVQLGLPVNEFFTEKDIEETAAGIRKVAEAYLK